MPDLREWITRQVDETEHVARRAASYDDGASHDVAGPEGTWAHLDESEWFGASHRGGVIAPRIGYTNAPELGAHIIRHDPAAVLRRCAADRKILADLLAEKHTICDDSWYHCVAADDNGDRDCSQPCGCGRDERVERRMLLIAEAYGWGEATHV